MTDKRTPTALAAAVSALTLALGVSGAEAQPLPKPAGTGPSAKSSATVKPDAAPAAKVGRSYDDESPKRSAYPGPGAKPMRGGDASATAARVPSSGRSSLQKTDESPKETRYRYPALPSGEIPKP